jgi:D-glycero-D-manno-heptose 1,7-bisphosphate phosphatase
MPLMNAAVFLDRDNTLIHNDGDLGDPDQVVLMQGVATAVASLRGLGFRIVVVTNQGGVARGKYTEQDVHRVHGKINDLIKQGANGATIDRFYFCPFHPEATVKKYKQEHPNRKPQPGMLLEAAAELALDLSMSWMIGDQMRDIQAGAAAGCRTILLREDADQLAPLDLDRYARLQVVANASQGEEAAGTARPDYIARSLVEAVRIVAQQRNKRETYAPGSAGTSAAAGAFSGGGGENPGSLAQPVRKWDAAAVARLQRASRKPAGPKPEGEAAATPSSARPAPAKPARPFRPWTAPPPPEAPASPEAPPPSSPPPEAASLPPPAPFRSPAPEAEAMPPAAALGESTSAMPVSAAAPASSQSKPALGAEASDAQAPREEAVESILEERGSARVTNALLRQVLQELRSQRATEQEFSYRSIVALVLQFAAVVCLLAALMMGGDSPMLFAKLATAAVLVQLLALGVLLTGK